jgi:hypothetical protein
MVWLQSHQELRSHPKTVKAARMLGVSLPTMVGHLHLLWWWALDHAPDGDLSKFDAEDIVMGAQFDGPGTAFVKALQACGPKGRHGFLTDDYLLHDWNEYGGKYQRRVEIAKQAAEARWSKNTAEQPLIVEDETDAHALPEQSASNAEERRGEEKRKDQERSSSRKRADRAQRLPDGWQPQPEPELISKLGVRKQHVDQELERFIDYWISQPGARGRKVNWQATWRNWLRRSVEIQSGGRPQEAPRKQPAAFGSPEWESQQEAERQLYAQLTGEDLL